MFQNRFSDNFMFQQCEKYGCTSHAQKQAARTHIPHSFQNGFRTHTHRCDRTLHVCVRGRTFATHTLKKILGFRKLFFIIYFIHFFQNVRERNLDYFNFQKPKKIDVLMHRPIAKDRPFFRQHKRRLMKTEHIQLTLV